MKEKSRIVEKIVSILEEIALDNWGIRKYRTYYRKDLSEIKTKATKYVLDEIYLQL